MRAVPDPHASRAQPGRAELQDLAVEEVLGSAGASRASLALLSLSLSHSLSLSLSIVHAHAYMPHARGVRARAHRRAHRGVACVLEWHAME